MLCDAFLIMYIYVDVLKAFVWLVGYLWRESKNRMERELQSGKVSGVCINMWL